MNVTSAGVIRTTVVKIMKLILIFIITIASARAEVGGAVSGGVGSGSLVTLGCGGGTVGGPAHGGFDGSHVL